MRFSERDGTLLSLAVFFAFGILAAGVLDDIAAAEALYAVLSLTVVRMAPVALALARTGLRMPSLAFMGWFGPRGIATIALLLVAVGDEPDLAGLDVVIRTVTATVLLSVVLHGVSAPALVPAVRGVGDGAAGRRGGDRRAGRRPAVVTRRPRSRACARGPRGRR